MIRVEGIRFTDGTNAVFDLQVSTASELPHIGDTIGDKKVDAGTIAEIIQAGTMATLDANDKFYAGGTEVSRS